jgi:hypothetical protein
VATVTTLAGGGRRRAPIRRGAAGPVISGLMPPRPPRTLPPVSRRPRSGSFGTHLAMVAAGALALRLVVLRAWAAGLAPEGDQLFYLRQAQYLAQGFGFVYRNPMQALAETAPPPGELVPTAAHPPLYAAWLGLVGLLHPPDDGHVPFRVASILLGVAAVVVIGLAARRVAGDRAGLAAAALAAVYPNLWINDVMILSESLFALTVALVLWAAVSYAADRSYRNAAFLGLTVALAALTRAEAQVLVVLLIVPLVLRAREPWPDRWRRLWLAVGVMGLVLAPWIVRNVATFDRHPLAVSTGLGYVLEISNCDQTYGSAPPNGSDGRPAPGASDDAFLGYWAVECDRTPWGAGDETMSSRAKQDTALAYVREHAARFPVVVAARIGRIWDVWRPGQSRDLNVFFERRGNGPTLAAMAMYYPLAVTGLAGLVVLRRRKETVIPYLALFAATTLTAAVSFGITRYRVGADVALTVLAGVAVDALARRLARARNPVAVVGGPDGPAMPVPTGAGTVSARTVLRVAGTTP